MYLERTLVVYLEWTFIIIIIIGFEWTDGSVVDYVAWNPDEPNNQALIGEDCVEMRFDGRGWNDKLCTSLKSWVCQIERGNTPNTTYPIKK